MFDVELTKHDLLGLSGRDALAGFFARLGYRTDARTVQAAANIGLAGEMAATVRHLEILAEHEFLQVWLFESTSVTVQTTRRLASAFRNRAGNFLLVLTSDYERIDFVLVEKLAPEAGSLKQVGVRPRALSLHRRDPGRIHLRVLRRFTFTETDGLLQYEKLLSAYSVADWSEEHFNNRALFSDYFLLERLRERPEWAEDPRPAFRAFAPLLDNARARLGGKPESAARSALILPALQLLGFEARAGKPAEGSATEPDYLLFAPGGTAPLALCLTYPWGRSLDGMDDRRDPETAEENPGAVVISLLDRGLSPWAVVTNGKLWRLYCGRAHSRATNYFEIDIEETLAAGDAQEAFRYFWLLFRGAAFEPADRPVDGAVQRVSFLDEVLLGSEAYAKRLGERLKDRVFEEIFPHLAEGFVHDIRAREGRAARLDEERMAEVFEGTLTLLYRLLFLLYAEARDLLPVRETRGYWTKSLTRLARQIAERAGEIEDESPEALKGAYRTDSSELYDRLSELFAAVAKGDPAMNVPVYNGGLFMTDPAPDDPSAEARNARFLGQWKVPDRCLAAGLDRMARDTDEKTHKLVPIDYKSLGVRQLGSIYEGLLEFRLRVDGKKVSIEATADARKALGSYYTPDFVVKHIVERTVGPIVAERTEALRQKFRAAARARRQTGKEQPEDLALADELFSITVLDPAMGSGHFLVEAVDFLTDRLLEFLAAFPRNPVQAALARTRQTILEEMERQGVTVDSNRLTEVNLTKRYVLKRCIYGVDLNPMAVELAKVSLWLDCFTLGAPLSFLDHHLRCGNSLAGSAVATVQYALRQQVLFERDRFADLALATDLMRHVGELSDVTARQVDESRKEYRLASGQLGTFKRLLDFYTGQWFEPRGAKGGRRKDGVPPVVDFLQTANGRKVVESSDPASTIAALPTTERRTAEAAMDAAERHRFFHWELEFPEVFYRDGQRMPDGGFQAIVGNPPWIRQEGLQEMKPLLIATFPETYDSVADIYVHFLARACQVARPGGRIGMIVPNKWIKAQYGEKLRAFLAEKTVPEELIDFGHAPLFDRADTFPCVLVLQKPSPIPDMAGEATWQLSFCEVPREALVAIDLPAFVARHAAKVPRTRLRREGWDVGAAGVGELMDRIRRAGVPLKEYASAAPLWGIKTGFNEAFLVDQETRDRLVQEDPDCEGIIKRSLRGENVRRWHAPWGAEWMIALASSENHQWPWAETRDERVAEQKFRKTYPSVHRWMKSHEGKLRVRQDHGRFWWELRSCDYYAEFERPKIVYHEIAFHSEFALEKDAHYSNNKTFILPTSDAYVLAILNSSLFWWFAFRDFPHMKDEAIGMQSFRMEAFPIPKPTTSSREALAHLAGRLVALTKRRQEAAASFQTRLLEATQIERTTRKIETYWELDERGILEEIRKARGRVESASAKERILRTFAKSRDEQLLVREEARRLEIDLHRRVFDLYGLSESEIQLLRETAPPRDPLKLAEGEEA